MYTSSSKRDLFLKIRSWLPDLRVLIVLPFIRIETTFMHERHDMYAIEWTGLYIQVWKYSFNVSLYWKPV